jgi:hypothetical protein
MTYTRDCRGSRRRSSLTLLELSIAVAHLRLLQIWPRDLEPYSNYRQRQALDYS